MNALYPNIRQRQILQTLMQAEWTPHQRLAPAGETTLGNLIKMGWIERRAAESGHSTYRMTEVGRQAFRIPMPLR
jgi:hypothetical protein